VSEQRHEHRDAGFGKKTETQRREAGKMEPRKYNGNNVVGKERGRNKSKGQSSQTAKK
jgi:hypothetical protein